MIRLLLIVLMDVEHYVLRMQNMVGKKYIIKLKVKQEES